MPADPALLLLTDVVARVRSAISSRARRPSAGVGHHPGGEGRTVTIRWCAACGAQRSAGELLLVVDQRDPRRTITICRPSVRPSCLVDAGPRERSTIELLDPSAAREVDATGADYEPRRVGRRAYDPQPTGAEQAIGATHRTEGDASQPLDRRRGFFDVGSSG
jgi:hypothetical protein